MQLSDLRTRVRNATLIESDDLADAVLTDYLNEAVMIIASRHEAWPWLQTTTTITTVDGTAAYAVPADYSRLIAIVNANDTTRLQRLAPEQALERWGGDFPEEADARWYFVYGSSFYLVPTPSANEADAYTVYYVKTPTAMSNDTDTPEFSSLFHYITTLHAISRVWEFEEDLDKAEVYAQKFERAIYEMTQYYRNRQEQWPRIYGDGTRPRTWSSNMPFLDDGTLAGL